MHSFALVHAQVTEEEKNLLTVVWLWALDGAYLR